MKRFFMAAILVFLFGATGTKADSTSGTINNPKQIPDSIVISTNRFPVPIEMNASSITVLTETDIQNSQTVMVSDLLKQVPGLDVVRSGGAGALTSVFMRGTNSDHTLVLIDGVEMNNPSSPTTSFDFGSLNVSNIQRIEILRGPQSVMYGSDAIGGVIQIFTKRGFGDLHTEIITEAGSYNSFNKSIHLCGNQKIFDFSIFASRKNSEGFSTIREDAGGFEKDGFESTDFIANLGIQLLTDYELSFNGRYNDVTTEIDGFDPIFLNPTDDPNYVSENKSNSVGVRFKSFKNDTKYFKPEISIALSKQELTDVNEEDDAHIGQIVESNSNGKRIKISTSNYMNMFENVNSIVGIEYENESFNSSSIYDTILEVSASTISLYGLDDWTVNEQFSVSGGLRYDEHEDFGGQLTYRFTSLYRFYSTGFSIKATLGTAFKAPSLYLLKHTTYGNRELQPEENLGWELGFEKSSPDKIINFGATYFSNEIDNLISYVYNPIDYSFIPFNIAEASSEGVEAFAQITFPKSSIRINMTYTDIKDKTNQSNILRRPEEKISLKINHQFSNSLQTSLLVRSIGDRFDTDYSTNNDVVLAGYTVVNLSSSYQLLETVVVTGRIVNLFDENYQDVLLYNTPNRSGYLGFKLTL